MAQKMENGKILRSDSFGQEEPGIIGRIIHVQTTRDGGQRLRIQLSRTLAPAEEMTILVNQDGEARDYHGRPLPGLVL